MPVRKEREMAATDRDQEKQYELMFQRAEGMFESELEGMKQLELEMRGEMQKVLGATESHNRRSGASPYTFMSNMYENLISLRSTRLSAVKDIATVKKMAADLQLKSDKGEGEEDAFRKIATQLMEMITVTENRQEGLPSPSASAPLIPNLDQLEILDAAAEEAAVASGAPDPSEAEEAAVKFVVEKGSGEILAINPEYRVLTDITPEPDRFHVIRNKKGAVVSAMDNITGEKLEVVE